MFIYSLFWRNISFWNHSGQGIIKISRGVIRCQTLRIRHYNWPRILDETLCYSQSHCFEHSATLNLSPRSALRHTKNQVVLRRPAEKASNLLILDISIEKWADITYCISYMNSRSEYRIRYLLYNNILVLLKFVTEKFSTLVSFLTFVNKQFRIMSLLKYRMHHCLIILKRIIEGNTDITTVTFAWAYALKITYNLQGWHFL